jgi:hypothetical protein
MRGAIIIALILVAGILGLIELVRAKGDNLTAWSILALAVGAVLLAVKVLL